MQSLFSGIYKDKTVLVTGHTGFKGSWLCFWLKQMGAKVVGYSLEAPTNPNHFELLNLDITSIKGNIKDLEQLFKHNIRLLKLDCATPDNILIKTVFFYKFSP